MELVAEPLVVALSLAGVHLVHSPAVVFAGAALVLRRTWKGTLSYSRGQHWHRLMPETTDV